MKIIVGLGNPGEKYERTRHNLGFSAVDKFLKDFGGSVWKDSEKFKGEIAHIEWQRQNSQKFKVSSFAKASKDKQSSKFQGLEKVILLKPKTYMNNSGLSVRIVSDFYKIKPENIWILHDDLDLSFGSLKIRLGGASAGHRGIESIIDNLGTDKFWRFRLGIGHPIKKLKIKSEKLKVRKVDDYVLGSFGHGEMGKARELIKRVVNAIETGLEDGLEATMNRFNSK
ncbi:MAG: aminoacyl-tRNA hydrolase [Candidatus Levybacteria bacterium CG_4_9_14_3_um_filter_35_16]|nr:MAG: aminoacyl-tRNA hydrolase [Candidatus Levybacteria bacterium CG22_combo_CG10-13_8_21_14_all_35_11]PIY95137.1 MAG: aminoacyl-tRNA hydrolase [Candidatus Levybacteria bacterium CG_4_10_14_0_8_um_filter_35_23]PIZ98185.1 MAG: aminoacyl-tRNA hydrolase [Candidatus Levybacteria bacterium CG_4_10_14_0_2_um_filter_35_8]PJA91022.1 MAG: aminoacyl-tRNA hydrolase [Candidatus Levybacteria bacterium CG_4_9_14_3_um_filter_35_16]PJC54741.1 MAG: aminoacyl-tRNA hydrolase [Candidatus Levybacteria bacterium C